MGELQLNINGDYESASSNMKSIHSNMQANNDLFPPSIPRGKLLQGPSSVLLISHAGSNFDYDHQTTVASYVVNTDRMRQLLEQSQSDHRPFCVEFPTRARVAASPAFAEIHESQGGPEYIPLSTGNGLPGFVMSVLDWYSRALQSKEWFDFLPEVPLTDNSEVWYYVYSYSAMRYLRLVEVADRLQKLIEPMLDGLCSDLNASGHLLRTLIPHDPVLLKLAQLTAQKMKSGSMSLSANDYEVLAEDFPDFATAVNRFHV